jgi:hypothetical protein
MQGTGIASGSSRTHWPVYSVGSVKRSKIVPCVCGIVTSCPSRAIGELNLRPPRTVVVPPFSSAIPSRRGCRFVRISWEMSATRPLSPGRGTVEPEPLDRLSRPDNPLPSPVLGSNRCLWWPVYRRESVSRANIVPSVSGCVISDPGLLGSP